MTYQVPALILAKPSVAAALNAARLGLVGELAAAALHSLAVF